MSQRQTKTIVLPEDERPVVWDLKAWKCAYCQPKKERPVSNREWVQSKIRSGELSGTWRFLKEEQLTDSFVTVVHGDVAR